MSLRSGHPEPRELPSPRATIGAEIAATAPPPPPGHRGSARTGDAGARAPRGRCRRRPTRVHHRAVDNGDGAWRDTRASSSRRRSYCERQDRLAARERDLDQPHRRARKPAEPVISGWTHRGSPVGVDHDPPRIGSFCARRAASGHRPSRSPSTGRTAHRARSAVPDACPDHRRRATSFSFTVSATTRCRPRVWSAPATASMVVAAVARPRRR